LKEIVIFTVPGVLLSSTDFETETIKGSFNFTEVEEIETGISKLGVTKFCIFNQPEDIRHNISNSDYMKYVDSISSYKAFNITSNIVQKDIMGVSIFKTSILISNLEPSDYIFLFMPTQLYSSDGNSNPSNFTTVTNLIPGT
jgi:hypothetical protein